ncbi:MAG: hypothetical protein J0H49_23475 [Acidobacteria bacterium]|nr:hypothetical protein [Acidobacteriota bacterium]
MNTIRDLPRAGENPANPGVTAEANWTFQDGVRSWDEHMDLLTTLRLLLEERGRSVRMEGPMLIDTDSSLSLRPLLSSMEPVHKGGVNTSTTIEVKHPARIQSPIFEYQHSSGPDLEHSFREGFGQWYDTDFVTLLEAMLEEAVDCAELVLESSQQEPSWSRRVTLGLPLRMASPVPQPPLEQTGHEFCSCCLFTSSVESFRPLLESHGFFALRLYAARKPDGSCLADCRVNGVPHPEGQQALLQYAKSWPGSGLEYRKQYILIQDK